MIIKISKTEWNKPELAGCGKKDDNLPGATISETVIFWIPSFLYSPFQKETISLYCSTSNEPIILKPITKTTVIEKIIFNMLLDW